MTDSVVPQTVDVLIAGRTWTVSEPTCARQIDIEREAARLADGAAPVTEQNVKLFWLLASADDEFRAVYPKAEALADGTRRRDAERMAEALRVLVIGEAADGQEAEAGPAQTF